ncbi:hypothetical protein NL676_037043 [Syzygium grande]|nr:hypothetical protein NL676_037043 [Syzygium grande]
MPETKAETASKNSKKANLLDQHSIKHVLDESASEIVKGRGYVEDVRMSNVRLLMGAVIIVIALFAQFYKKKFPENRDFLIGCIGLYPFFPFPILAAVLSRSFGVLRLFDSRESRLNIADLITIECFRWGDFFGTAPKIGFLNLLIYTKEKNAIMFTYAPAGSFNSTGLVVSSKLPRFSDLYTLTIVSADPKSISANKPVELTKSVTQWFTKDGFLVEGLFWKDVEALINEYNQEPKKSK